MDVPSGSSHSESQGRQKRVLPSRSRRGGPGVGSCDVDVMILETQRRKFESEPLIPTDTPFLLTTNSAVASASSSSYRINVHANDSYFERPEVLKAYREQLIIQTPDFISLGDVTSGRLRARSQAGITEDGPSETSDAAYEKRHRKYETFEKRLRLREKEKLKHEQYKLKERIEQLRAMDASAFMSLPDNIFPAPAGQPDTDSEGSISGAQMNGSPTHSEGERRRKEMLDIAYTLEDRYRVLLPPDRPIKKAPGPRQTIMEASVEPEVVPYVGRERQSPEPRSRPVVETTRQDVERLKLKIKFPTRPIDPMVYVSTSKQAPLRQRRQSSPSPRVSRRNRTIHEAPSFRGASPVSVVDPSISSILVSPLPQQAISAPATPISNPGIAVLGPSSPESEFIREEPFIFESTEGRTSVSPRQHKRFRASSKSSLSPSHQISKEPSIPPIESISDMRRHRSPSHASTVQSSKYVPHTANSGKKDRTPSLLMTQAIRSSGNRANKTKRHLYAFGGKVQNEMFEEAEFKLPDWVLGPSDTPEPDTSDLPIVLEPNVRIILTPGEIRRQPFQSSIPNDAFAST